MGRFKVGDRVNWTRVRGEFDGSTIEAIDGAGARCVWPVTIRARNGRSIYVDFHELELAPLFAVGDKVRSLISGFDITACKTYEVDEVDTTGVYIIDDDGDRNWLGNSDVEPATTTPTYASCASAEVDNLADEYGGRREDGPKFKVGDRVRNALPCNDYKGDGTITEINDTIVIEWDNVSQRGCGDLGWKACDLELAPPATLTIQAGRCYRTRDGRKVGPMVPNRIWPEEYPFTVEHSFTATCAKGWRADGSFDPDGETDPADLTSEWPYDVPLRGVSPVVAPATTAKFNVGDRVKFRDDYGSSARGKEAIVTKVDERGIQVDLGGDRWNISTEQPRDLVLLPATTMADIVRKHSGTAVVMLIENGQPKPSTAPFVHADASAAGTEASRLAGIHKGQEFGVYTCVDVRKEEKTYEHEWQRLAVDGERIQAIKSYREAGGKRETFVTSEFGYRSGYETRFVIGLKEAKDAVEYWLATAA